ncbi:MAG: TetR/AcrR family transcriptional regulator [Mycobacteriaceae bacterium]|nr:TetR/AcrR family transcriptional regulator [Mycobacteriaceae bacterium]
MVSRLSVQERRALLIDAAVGLAERKGVAGVTTRDVAKAAGVSLGVVHYCFENKDALMFELVQAMSSALRDCVDTDAGLWERVGTGRDALRTLVRATLGMLWLNVEASRRRQLLGIEAITFMLREGTEFAEPSDGSKKDGIGRIAMDQYAANDARIAEVLARASGVTDTAWSVSTVTLSRFVVTMLDGIVLRWLVDEDGAAARTQLDILTDVLMSQVV